MFSSVLFSVLGFFIILCPLVVVHEFGHFFFAKLFGVKAEAFSVGFGPVFWKKQVGETEFRLSAIPLGGYVKLLGEDREAELPPEDQGRALHQKPPWQRFFVFFGGPLFNFIFAIFVFMAILVIGEPKFSNTLGRVIHSSPAYQQGLRSGDKVVALDHKQVKLFREIFTEVMQKPKTPILFEIERQTSKGIVENLQITVTPSAEEGYSMYGEEKPVGILKGVVPIPRGNVIGVSDPKSQAGKAGLVTRDKITEFNGVSVSNWENLERLYSEVQPNGVLNLKVEDEKGVAREVGLRKPAVVLPPGVHSENMGTLGKDLGLFSSEMFIDKVVENSPAFNAGMRSGDRIMKVGPAVLESFYDLKDQIQSQAGKIDSSESDNEGENAEETEPNPLMVTWQRNGKIITENFVPDKNEEKDPTLNDVINYTIGVLRIVSVAEPVTIVERVWNPFTLIYKSTYRMVEFTWRNIISLGKMMVGDVSVKHLGGPILIAKIAGDSIQRGLVDFLRMMAIISIGLGLLNVLPIPVLDGGHLLILGIEAVRRKPLSLRQLEVFQQVGLTLILLLMVVVFKNDIMRLF